jgi:hypothetical protein
VTPARFELEGGGVQSRGGRIRRRRLAVELRAPLTLLFSPAPRATATASDPRTAVAAPLCLAFFADGERTERRERERDRVGELSGVGAEGEICRRAPARREGAAGRWCGGRELPGAGEGGGARER